MSSRCACVVFSLQKFSNLLLFGLQSRVYLPFSSLNTSVVSLAIGVFHMPLPNIRPDFDIDARPHIFRSPTEWASFWHGLAPWFEPRGYTLHTPGSKTSIGLSDGFTVPVRDTCQPQHPPFAYTNVSAGPGFIYDSHPREPISTVPQQSRSAYRPQTESLVPVQVPPYVATSNTGRVYAAQDSLGRHVYIKILKKDSEQLRVVELLRQQKETPGVLPILDVLEYDEEHAFLVMPRWADIPGPNNLLRSVKDVGEFVVDILKVSAYTALRCPVVLMSISRVSIRCIHCASRIETSK